MLANKIVEILKGKAVNDSWWLRFTGIGRLTTSMSLRPVDLEPIPKPILLEFRS